MRGRGLRHPLPDGPQPEFWVYLLKRDPGPFGWDHRWVQWPDFLTPTSTDDAIAALAEVYGRAASERVEIACGGCVGRTGTGLAAIAVLAGVPQRSGSESAHRPTARHNSLPSRKPLLHPHQVPKSQAQAQAQAGRPVYWLVDAGDSATHVQASESSQHV